MEHLREPVLYVGEIEDDMDILSPPTSGEEYIKRVILEARKCEEVVVAKIDEKKLNNQAVKVQVSTDCASTPDYLIPTKEWQECQVKDFSKTRMYITRLKSKKKSPKKDTEKLKLPDIDDNKAWIEICASENCSIDPTLGLILTMNQPTIESVLEHLVDHVKNQKTMNHKLGAWIYALLAALEVPLNPDTCSCLRLLAKCSSIIRMNLNSSESPILKTLNLFICLVSRYFRQLDLMDQS